MAQLQEVTIKINNEAALILDRTQLALERIESDLEDAKAAHAGSPEILQQFKLLVSAVDKHTDVLEKILEKLILVETH